jgi:RHS repeat-associated protein
VTVYLPATVNYTYDLNGNLLSDGNRCFAYDDENHLTSIWVTNVWRTDFVYDGKLRRRIERDYTWQSGNWVATNEVHYVYDGNLVIQEQDMNNNPLVTYTRGTDLSGSLQGAGGIGGLLARTDANGSTFYHADGNGNISALINGSQTIVAKYLYDPYGNTLSMNGPLAGANTYRFSSKEWNANSGLYYYLYRCYDPNLQRWPNRDPIGELGFELVSHGLKIDKEPLKQRQRAALNTLRLQVDNPTLIALIDKKLSQLESSQNGDPNLYLFVRNDPVIMYDPLGLDWADRYTQCMQMMDPWGLCPYSTVIAPGSYLTKGLAGKICRRFGAVTIGWCTGISYGCMITALEGD